MKPYANLGKRMADLTNLPSWQQLIKHYEKINTTKITSLFTDDIERLGRFSFQAAGICVDYSKQKITTETMQLLCNLATEANLPEHIADMFSGKPINNTENRAVLHTALRDPDNHPEVAAVLKKLSTYVEKIRSGAWAGYSNKPITDIVNIGIGGSDLGPAMAVQALTPYTSATLNTHFVSNVDGTHISETLRKLNPETTLFIIASKTFTTQETLCNANTAKEWLEQKATGKQSIKKHLLAVTANPERACEFGIAEANVFPFWDWVGGRYSLWSAIGAPIALATGMENFRQLLAGAHAMDEHFKTRPLPNNLPVILGLLDIWNINFFNMKTHAILPYDQYLSLLPSYLQQLEMESNGKRVDVNGKEINYSTAPIIWGAAGTNGQHAFHQLLMQGTQQVPVDFILPIKSHNPIGQHHQLFNSQLLRTKPSSHARSQ